MLNLSWHNRQQVTVMQPSPASLLNKEQHSSPLRRTLSGIEHITLFLFLAVLICISGLSAVSQQSTELLGNTASLVPASALSNSETLPGLEAAKVGDINAKYRQVIKTIRADGKVTLTLRDNDTGERFTLTQPIGTKVVARTKERHTEVLTRMPSVPECIDMEKYAFPTSSIETIKTGQQVVTRNPVTEDYVPLLPWLGVMWWGVAAGSWLTRHRPAAFTQPLPVRLKPLVGLGRWSLTYYMLHQPVLIGGLMGVSWIMRSFA